MQMKSSMWKTTFREIKQSFGRFFAILAIVALGVGLFAGLKVTKPAMVKTTQEYLEKHQFYDFCLLSTLGFEQEEVSFLHEQEEVRAAEGAVSFDILCQNSEDSEFVIKTHSLTEHVNGIDIIEGRMPESANECVVDANMSSLFSIGEKITISEENAEEDKEHFSFQEYNVVGIVKSSYYIQFERGNSSLGTGRIAGFIYLLPEGYNVDYFTEVFVKFDKDMPIFSEEYETFIKEKKAVWEPLTQEAAESRLNDLLSEAREELEDGKKELAEKKAEAEIELEDARLELEDAALEISDGEEKLADAKKELKDARETLVEKSQELADGENTLAEEEQKLMDGEQELQDSIDLWKQENDKIEKGKLELNDSQQELDSNLAILKEQETSLYQKEQIMLGQEEELLTRENILNQEAEQLDKLEADLLEQYQTIPEPWATQIAQGRQEIEYYREQIEVGKKEIENGKLQLAAGKEQIAYGYAEIENYQSQIDASRQQIQSGDRLLGEAWMKIEDGKADLEEGRKAFADARRELEDGKKQIEDAEQDILYGEKELADAEQELLDGKIKYEDGLREYNEGYEEFQQEIADAEEKIADAEQEIADLKTPKTYVLDRNTNVGYACFENDSRIVEGIANIFPVFFFLVAALVCITTMNRMVEEQRTQIGVLKALGYGEAVIMSKYLFYSGTAAVIGCGIGFFGGTYLFPRVIWTGYGLMYHIDKLVYVFDGVLGTISLMVALFCSMGVTWFSCRYALYEVAAELMRPKAPAAGKRVLLEKVPFIWKRMKFLYKVSYRNIFRYKKRFFMMVIGISGCTALLVTAFGIKDSIANVAIRQFEEIQMYDVDITYKEPVNEKTGEQLSELLGENLTDYIFVYSKMMDLAEKDKVKAVNLIAIDEDADVTSYLNLYTKEGKELPYPGKGEVILSHKAAKDLDVRVGDSITLQDDNMPRINAVVSGISENFIYNYAYINSETYRSEVGIEPEYKSIYMNLSEHADFHLVSAALMQNDDVAVVTVMADIMERFMSTIKGMDLIVLVIILCAAGLAFIVLYNLSNINITERIREIATIKVLGFYKKETLDYVFRENVVLTLIGAGVGLILGRFLHLFIMNQIKMDAITFDIHIKPLSYLYSIGLTCLFAWFINTLMGSKIEHINMTESLKAID